MTFSNDENKQKMNFSYNFSYPEVAFQAGFRLRQFKEGELDWRLIGNVEVDRILREQNVEQLDKVLQHLAEAPLAGILDSNILDSGIAKYFMLSQFALQYLLFCRNFLDETLAEIRHVYAESQSDVAFLRKSLSEANREILLLHKKISQIEAIREIIYPCHLCTKNFVNNESLNLHLSRRHNKYWSSTNTQTSNTNTTGSQPVQQHHKVSIPSTMENDLELINRIKLELEIKQLKERLNVAEKEVRQRRKNSQNLADTSTSEVTGEELIVMSKPKLRGMGIQCNLAESKEQSVIYSVPEEEEEQEQDEAEQETEIEIESGTSNEKLRGDHDNLMVLEEKVHDFENWRHEQMATNQQNITEINEKLKEITIALDNVKNLKINNVMELPKTMTAVDKNSIEILERQLTQKITEIGQLSSEKIQQIILNMEGTYNKKLQYLEEEIKRNNLIKETTAHVTKIPRLVKVLEQNKISTARTDEMPSTSKPQLQTESISESNRTFIKSESLPEQIYKNREAEILSDTDVSEGLNSASEDSASENDESNQSDSSSSLELKPLTNRATKEKLQEFKLKAIHLKKSADKIKEATEPKLVTRKDIKRMSNNRMSEFDCNLRQKKLPAGSMKKITQKLNDRRIQDKQKYPTFYATRNRIKKYVDRLCSKKPNTNVEQVLKETLPVALQPTKPPRKNLLQTTNKLELELSREEVLKDGLDETQLTATSTPNKLHDQSDFRQRLERILASPIHKPGELNRAADDDVNADNSHAEMYAMINKFKPLPMPRKRVMFSTRDVAEGLQQKQE